MTLSPSSLDSPEFLPSVRELESLFEFELPPSTLERLRIYLELLLRWQARVNLVAETSLERLLRLHFFESFWLAEHFLAEAAALTDIGSGAGFPGLAAGIYRPDLAITLIESQQRRALFLEELTRRLQLRQVSLFPGRWQDFAAWQTGGIVSVRALHVSPDLARTLAAADQILLLLHSSALAGALEDHFRTDRTRRIPGSRDRWISRLLPNRVG